MLVMASCVMTACIAAGGEEPAGEGPGAAADDAPVDDADDDGQDADLDTAVDDESGAPTGTGLIGVRDGRASDTAGGAAGAAAGDDAASADGDAASDIDATGDGDGAGVAGADDDAAPIRDDLCDLGMPDAVTGTHFTPLQAGDTVPMIGVGQAELSIDLAVLVYLFEGHEIDLLVEVDDSGRSSSLDAELESDFVCDDSGWCEWVGILVDTTPLVDDPFDLMRLPVTVTLTVRDAVGPYCQTRFSGPLLRRE
jgi:hypothetical protein